MRKTAACQRIPLHVFHAALDLALGPRPIRLARARREAVVPCEVLEARMPQHLACGATQRDRARIVVQTRERHAAEVTQGALVAIEQRVETLVAISVRHRPSRETEREDKEVDRRRDLANPDLQLTEIDLRLLPGARLKAHRRSRRPAARRPQRLERSLHLLIAAGEALRPELAKQHAPIPAHLRTAPRQKLPVRVDRLRVHPRRPRLPDAPPPPALNRLLVDPELARDRLDRLPAGQPR